MLGLCSLKTGSCWAFAATEQIESEFVLAGGPSVVLSAQQVTSCTVEYSNSSGRREDLECCYGCDGGDPSYAYEVLAGGVGLSPAAWWPYTQSLTRLSETEPCRKDTSELVDEYFYLGPYATIASYSYAVPPCSNGACESQDVSALAAAAAESPVAVCVNAETWDDYVGGVMSLESCGGVAITDLDHCVQLVGYNSVADKPYWILRNSWSAGWGQDGFIYLQFGENTCGIPTHKKTGGVSFSFAERARARWKKHLCVSWQFFFGPERSFSEEL